jgi:hypothetical protein
LTIVRYKTFYISGCSLTIHPINPMKTSTSYRPLIALGAISLAGIGLLGSAQAQSFTTKIFTDNFLTSIAPPGATTNLNTNIGEEGGRQGGDIVALMPWGFGYSVYGQRTFSQDNGWDLRAQENWPASGPIDTHTLRLRNDVVNWSTVSPNLGFVNNGTPHQIENLNYRIQVQVTHAHPDNNTPVLNDRWAGISFGLQPDVRFPLFAANGGVIIYPSGSFQIFANGNVVGAGSAQVAANGAYSLDLRVVAGIASLYVNGTRVASDADVSSVTPGWIGLTGYSDNKPEVYSSAQFRFDNLIISTLGPDPDGTYEAWVAETWGESIDGITGRMDDPDGDGLVNLVEYALARDPQESDRSDVLNISAPTEAGAGYSLTYRQRADMEDAVVFPQRSTDLINWLPATAAEVDTYFSVETGGTEPSDEWQSVTAVDREAPGASARLFYRLQVETAEP